MRPTHLVPLLLTSACGARWEPLGWDTAPSDTDDSAAPIGPTVTIEPAAPITGDTLTCVHDPVLGDDGAPLPVSYAWTIDGADAGVDAGTLDGARVVRGSAVQCAVIEGASTWGSDAVLIGNAPPGAPAVAFARALVVPGTPAACVVTAAATDLEGDPISYAWAWTVNGADVGSGETLDTSALAAGDELTCTATPWDGYDAGAPGAASLALGAATTGERAASDAWLVIAGTSASGAFGKAVDVVGDLDGDGLGELLVSAPKGAGSSRGALYLFGGASLTGGERLDADADAWWIGHAADDNLGAARGAAGVGDLDGDGLGDLVGAAPWHDEGGAAAGAVYLLYGGDPWTAGGDIEADAPARLIGAAGDWLGARVAGGDLDGDGLGDVVATGPYNDIGGTRAGVAAVWLGGARPEGALVLSDADALVTGALMNTELGWALGVAGDADGDGYGELLVGIAADDTNALDAGAAAAVSGDALGGTATYEDAAWLVVRGLATGGRFGYDVAGAGDVDGDGLEDLVFGAYLADDAGTDAGAARLFFGGAGRGGELDADAADVTLTGAGAGEQFGSAITRAGDFDGDGLSDLLVGGPRSSASAAEAGAASLYLGREHASWAAGPSLRITGDVAGDWLGDELAGGLDANADGFSDLALGAQGADLGAAGGGAVYVFVGP